MWKCYIQCKYITSRIVSKQIWSICFFLLAVYKTKTYIYFIQCVNVSHGCSGQTTDEVTFTETLTHFDTEERGREVGCAKKNGGAQGDVVCFENLVPTDCMQLKVQNNKVKKNKKTVRGLNRTTPFGKSQWYLHDDMTACT